MRDGRREVQQRWTRPVRVGPLEIRARYWYATRPIEGRSGCDLQLYRYVPAGWSARGLTRRSALRRLENRLDAASMGL